MWSPSKAAILSRIMFLALATASGDPRMTKFLSRESGAGGPFLSISQWAPVDWLIWKRNSFIGNQYISVESYCIFKIGVGQLGPENGQAPAR